MVILIMQLLSTVLTLWFGYAALRVARLPTMAFGRCVQRDAWWVAGAGFALLGAHSLLQQAAATRAFFSGPGSPAWNSYVRWMPVGNDARLVLVIAMGLALIALTLDAVPRGRRGRSATLVLYAAALVLGSLIGWMEVPAGPTARGHYLNFALLSTVESSVMLAALMVGLVSGTLGGCLWACLSLYSLVLILNVGSFSALAWATEAWRIPSYVVRIYPLVFLLLMVALARHQLARARRGVPERALLEPRSGLPVAL